MRLNRVRLSAVWNRSRDELCGTGSTRRSRLRRGLPVRTGNASRIRPRLALPVPYAFALLELTVALSVLMAAMMIGAAAFAQTVAARKLYDRRLAARETVILVFERLRAELPAKGLPEAAKTREVPLPPALAARLPGGKCELSSSAVATNPHMLRLKLEVRWGPGDEVESGEMLRPVGLESGSAEPQP